jgi:PilZ domain-containing protein
MPKGDSNNERRRSRRFQVGWGMSFAGRDWSGSEFDEAATLANLSSGGAFFYCQRTLGSGAAVELRIRVPFRKEAWMKYAAQVVRLEDGDGVAVRFDKPKPIFIST